MKHIKNQFYNFKQLFSNRIIFIFLILQVLLLESNVWNIIFRAKFYKLNLSTADIILSALDNTFFPIVAVISCIVFASILNSDFNHNVIIQHKSRQRIWFNQVGKIVILSIPFAFVYIFSAVLNGFFICEKNVNFTDVDTFFKLATFETMKENPSLWHIALSAFVGAFLIFVFVGLLTTLSKWVFNNYVASVIILIAGYAYEFLDRSKVIEAGKVHGILFVRIIPYYQKWIDVNLFYRDIIYPLVWIICCIIIGYFVSRRKEFLNAQQK